MPSTSPDVASLPRDAAYRPTPLGRDATNMPFFKLQIWVT